MLFVLWLSINKDNNNKLLLFCLLQDHLHDVNAFVRSKVLQIWMNIVNAKVCALCTACGSSEYVYNTMHVCVYASVYVSVLCLCLRVCLEHFEVA